VQALELVTWLKDGGLLVALCYAMYLGSKLAVRGFEVIEGNTKILSRIEGRLKLEHESDSKLKKEI
jgi:hypothetical protein